jgi:hypothetical protein
MHQRAASTCTRRALARSCVAALVTAATLLVSAPAPASADARLTVSPLIIDLRMEPGESTTRTVSVTASGDEPIDVAFQHADFGFNDSRYQVTLIEDTAERTTHFSTRDWFSTPKPRYHVKAGTTMDIPVTIAVPTNATPGTHLGAAFFRTVGTDDDKGATRILTSARAGPLIFIGLQGGSKPKARLTAFHVPSLLAAGPVRVKVRATNEGSTHYTMEGTVRLKGAPKAKAITIPKRYVLPQQPRSLLSQDNGPLVLGDKHLGMGRYEVQIDLSVEPGQQSLTGTRTVWIVPWWIRIVAAIAAAMVIAGLIWGVLWVRDRRLAPYLELAQLEVDDDFDDDLDTHDERDD